MAHATRDLHSTSDPFVKYAASKSLRLHPVQEKLIEATKKHAHNRMLSSADQQQFLSNLCTAIGATKTIDIGVFTGYSALSIALNLPEDGKVIACDINNDYVSIANPMWKEAEVDHKIQLEIAPATETLERLIANGEEGTFDYIFIDADKENYDAYYELGLKLLRRRGLIAIDNVWWGGKVADVERHQESSTNAIRALNDKLHKDDRIDISMLPIADGVTLAWKKC